ncbi:MAG: hypothetical protein RL254_723, partial [Planctomycetota bacterium]
DADSTSLLKHKESSAIAGRVGDACWIHQSRTDNALGVDGCLRNAGSGEGGGNNSDSECGDSLHGDHGILGVYWVSNLQVCGVGNSPNNTRPRAGRIADLLRCSENAHQQVESVHGAGHISDSSPETSPGDSPNQKFPDGIGLARP